MIVADFIALRIFVEVDSITYISCAADTICDLYFGVIYKSQLWSTFALLLSPLSSCPNHFCGEIRMAVVLVLFTFSGVFVSHCIKYLQYQGPLNAVLGGDAWL